jgi:hypothetical protein
MLQKLCAGGMLVTPWVDNNFGVLIMVYAVASIGFCVVLLWTPITALF